MKTYFYFVLGYDKYINKSGKYSLYLIIKFPYDNREKKVMIKGMKMRIEHWNTEEKWVKRTHPEFRIVNAVLERITKELEELQLNFIRDNMPFNIAVVRKYINAGFSGEHRTFNQYCYNCLEKERGIKKSTKYMLKNDLINHIDTFDPEINFWELEPKFLEKFKLHLANKNIKESTQARIINTLSRFCNKARLEGLLPKYPFEKNQFINVKKTEKEFLREDEVEKLFKLEVDKKKQIWKTKMRFLFSCYTGLRWSDITDFSTDDIENNVLKRKALKTNSNLVFPLDKFFNKRALDILNETMIRTRKTFPYVSTSDDNYNIKDLCKMAGINKHVTFHTARHTFFTLMAKKVNKQFELMRYTGLTNANTALNYIHFADEYFENQ